MEWLTSFAWTDEQKALHIDIPKMLQHMRVADTPANRELVAQWARDYLRQHTPRSTIVVE